jgi:hypothetical protein
MTGHLAKLIFGLAALSAATLVFTSSAEAGKPCKGRICRHAPYPGERGIIGYVTAEATFGGKTVTAPVRPGRWSDQVRLPGGTWVDCEITCEYTLRRNTVDFWDSQGNRNFVSPGYFRFDLDLDTGRVTRRGPPLFGRY